MTPIMRRGLLNLEGIRKVLDKEGALPDYRALRHQLGEDEPVLDRNLKHWIKQELMHLSGRYPQLTGDQLRWMGHLLERYFVRGFYMCREANAELLSQWYSGNCEDPPDHEKIDDVDESGQK